MAQAELKAFILANNITIEHVFVPFSHSRSKSEKHYNLNWRVTLKVRDRALPQFDYSAGQAHCPAYKLKAPNGNRYARQRMIDAECETGKIHKLGWGGSDNSYASRHPVPGPDIVSVLASLALDANVLDHASFEAWADDYGYDTDSRKAHQMYQDCLQHALALRALLGGEHLVQLQQAAQDY